MIKLFRTILFSLLLLASGTELGAQDQAEIMDDIDMALADLKASSSRVKQGSGVPDPSAPDLTNPASAHDKVVPAAIAEPAVVSTQPGWFSRTCSSIWNGVSSKFNENPVRNSVVVGAACLGVTYWAMQKYKHNWMDQIEAKVKQPNISPSPVPAQIKQNFYWAKWCTQPSDYENAVVYTVPKTIHDMCITDFQTNILDPLVNNISQQKAFVFANGDRRRISVFANQIKNNDVFIRAGLESLISAIEYEQAELRQDLMRLSGELETDNSTKYLAYFKNIFTSFQVETQSKVESKLCLIINGRQNRNIVSLGHLYQLKQEDLSLRTGFVSQYHVLLYNQRAAGLYFDVAVAYGRLEAIRLKIAACLNTQGFTV